MNDSKYEIVKFIEGELELNVNVSPEEETIWMSIEEMSLLYDVDRTGISRHLKNIYKSKELEEDSTCAKIAHVGSLNIQQYEKKLYNLDVIIAVGYRVKLKWNNF